ncbi:MAG: hypothetical protein WDA06_00855 [Phenylobacterium sp.]
MMVSFEKIDGSSILINKNHILYVVLSSNYYYEREIKENECDIYIGGCRAPWVITVKGTLQEILNKLSPTTKYFGPM